MKNRSNLPDIIINIFFVLLSLCFVIPLILVISASFTSEIYLTSGESVSLIPRGFTFDAYESAFRQGSSIGMAYLVTFSQAVIGTSLACLFAGMAAYPLARTNFRFKGFITGFIFFTMLFTPGMIPSYITFTSYYDLRNNFLVYILPGIAGGAWNTLIFRTFFKGLPEALFESAKIDGARELTTFFRIVLPLSKPAFASIGFMTLVTKWNDYTTSMIYIDDENLYTLQYLLQKLMAEAEFLQSLVTEGIVSDAVLMELPSESLKYAMCIISAGPMLFVFPFFQKYFSKGLTIGAVKG